MAQFIIQIRHHEDLNAYFFNNEIETLESFDYLIMQKFTLVAPKKSLENLNVFNKTLESVKYSTTHGSALSDNNEI